MPFQKYIEDVQKQFKTGIAREHAYRPTLKTLVEDIMHYQRTIFALINTDRIMKEIDGIEFLPK
jgi:hypothetical protein